MGDYGPPHTPQPSDICSTCGMGLVHITPSMDPRWPDGEAAVEELAAALDGHREDFVEQPESFDNSRAIAENILRRLRGETP